ncbi:MAG TPA: indolepyruvate ferredoxin oxidoreductase [Desulfobacteraceae bacterium]|nr:indolepyruvate ferredoxin oxidoreductase [Desulfobacteraceae bacterium]
MTMISEKTGGIALLQGNESIARGALEAGVTFCAGYPGNPSSEIIETLAKAAKDLPIYVEWSVNEKVAFEAATAASYAGCRALASQKSFLENVISDFLLNMTMSGTNGGLVLITCDDPAGISSTNEEDARLFARMGGIPLLEPATAQEAIEMTKWAFELSEAIKNVVILRSVSRLSHTRSSVQTGLITLSDAQPFFDTSKPYHTFPVVAKHEARNQKLDQAREIFETSHFNTYEGPEAPELLVISSGCPWNYAAEAVELMELGEKVGLLKIGTTWPLPVRLLEKYLKISDKIMFLEEVEPFLEDNVKSLAAQLGHRVGVKTYYGKMSGAVPSCGELTPGLVMKIFSDIFHLPGNTGTYKDEIDTMIADKLPVREFGFCPGCPHRASFYAIKTALAWDDRNGFVSGDIGCYTMGIWPTGFNQVKSVHAMGSGSGLACGYGKLERFGFDQPVITVCGDSTFFHAGIPGLVNAKFNGADIFLIILDNSATAMTGFQPHPGTGITAMGDVTEPVLIENICRSIGADVEVTDPYELKETAERIYRLMKKTGPRVLILRRKCALVQGREGGFPFNMHVDPNKCIGEDCGCGRYCTRIFRCPGLIWNSITGKSEIDRVICAGCGICVDICPQNAIIREGKVE